MWLFVSLRKKETLVVQRAGEVSRSSGGTVSGSDSRRDGETEREITALILRDKPGCRNCTNGDGSHLQMCPVRQGHYCFCNKARRRAKLELDLIYQQQNNRKSAAECLARALVFGSWRGLIYKVFPSVS